METEFPHFLYYIQIKNLLEKKYIILSSLAGKNMRHSALRRFMYRLLNFCDNVQGPETFWRNVYWYRQAEKSQKRQKAISSHDRKCDVEIGSPLLKASVFLEVLHLLLGVGDDGVGAGLPPRRTHLAVLVGVLRRRQAKCLIEIFNFSSMTFQVSSIKSFI